MNELEKLSRLTSPDELAQVQQLIERLSNWSNWSDLVLRVGENISFNWPLDHHLMFLEDLAKNMDDRILDLHADFIGITFNDITDLSRTILQSYVRLFQEYNNLALDRVGHIQKLLHSGGHKIGIQSAPGLGGLTDFFIQQ